MFTYFPKSVRAKKSSAVLSPLCSKKYAAHFPAHFKEKLSLFPHDKFPPNILIADISPLYGNKVWIKLLLPRTGIPWFLLFSRHLSHSVQFPVAVWPFRFDFWHTTIFAHQKIDIENLDL